jgi:hypothetical protein
MEVVSLLTFVIDIVAMICSGHITQRANDVTSHFANAVPAVGLFPRA